MVQIVKFHIEKPIFVLNNIIIIYVIHTFIYDIHLKEPINTKKNYIYLKTK